MNLEATLGIDPSKEVVLFHGTSIDAKERCVDEVHQWRPVWKSTVFRRDVPEVWPIRWPPFGQARSTPDASRVPRGAWANEQVPRRQWSSSKKFWFDYWNDEWIKRIALPRIYFDQRGPVLSCLRDYLQAHKVNVPTYGWKRALLTNLWFRYRVVISLSDCRSS